MTLYEIRPFLFSVIATTVICGTLSIASTAQEASAAAVTDAIAQTAAVDGLTAERPTTCTFSVSDFPTDPYTAELLAIPAGQSCRGL